MSIDRDLAVRLPEPVRDEAWRLLSAQDHGSLVSLLDDYLTVSPPRPAHPAVLLSLALARIRWATEVMVDRVLPFGELALVHVAAARADGAAPEDAEAVERLVRDTLDHERERRRAEQEDAPVADQIQSRAYRDWDAGRPARAAELFEDAARHYRVEGRTGVFNLELRAALCWAQAGEEERARPVLERAMTYDWAAAGIWNDRATSEKAAMFLLRWAARRGTAEFVRAWDRAVANGDRVDWPFPSIYPHQEELLDLTLRLDLPGQCRHVLAKIRARDSRLDRVTLAKVEAAERRLQAST
jgi:hypothetical protein